MGGTVRPGAASDEERMKALGLDVSPGQGKFLNQVGLGTDEFSSLHVNDILL